MRLLPASLSLFIACAATAQLVRQPNTTLVMPANPPSQGYAVQSPYLPGSALDPAFNFPVKIVTPPGDPANRIFVVERTGLIKYFDPATPTAAATTFMDLTDRVASSTSQGEERGLLGLAFHPQWATNGYFYVYYSNSSGGANQRLSRFQFTAGNPNTGDRTTEVNLMRQADPASNHNGGDIMFGPDGYLYFTLGDGGGSNDSTGNSQRIDGGFFSGLMRIDVDRRAANLEPNPHASVPLTGPGGVANYKVPADNPWVGATSFNGATVNPANVRTEFWAVGLRNPWRMNFDPATGRIYIGDVGQGAREEIDLGVKGANYGWKFYEGFNTTGLGTIPSSGFTHTPPLIDYPRSDGFAVTGGVVYRGTNIAQLYGQYIFADYGGGFWRLPINETTGANIGGKVSMGVTPSLPVAFGTDPRNGDVLIAQLGSTTGAGRIRRLVLTGAPSGSFPATLSATGAFANLATLAPNPGIVAYEPNVSFWSDHAVKRRWFSIPNVNDDITFTPTGAWTTPVGTVFIKHFEIATTRNVANPVVNKRLETRFLVRNASGVYGLTYKWNAAGTEADLVPEGGATESFPIVDETGQARMQTWTYPSRASCLNCHTQVGGYTLSFNSQQLNKAHDYGTQTQNQIEALNAAGYFANPGSVPPVQSVARFAKATDTDQSVEWRVRSYLAVNCVSCHQPGGLGVGNWDARHTTKTADAGLINGALVNNLGDPANRVLASNDLAHSVMYQRIASAGGAANHMPPIATNETNLEAANLLSQWVTGAMTTYQSFAQWQVTNFGSTTAPAAQAGADPDGDGNSNRFEYLTGTGANNAASRWTYRFEMGGRGNGRIVFPRIANRRFLALVSNDLQTWTPWNVPGNDNGVSATSFEDMFSGPVDPEVPQFFRLQIDEP